MVRETVSAFAAWRRVRKEKKIINSTSKNIAMKIPEPWGSTGKEKLEIKYS